MHKQTIFFATLVASFSLLGPSTNAQELTWVGAVNNLWSLSDQNWTDGLGVSAWVDNREAIFAGPGPLTVTVHSSTSVVRADRLLVFQDGLTIDGAPFALNNLQMVAPRGAVLDINTLLFEAATLNAVVGLGNTAIIRPNLTTPGDSFIVNDGRGTLILTGDLDSGTVTINRGTLQLGDGANFTTGEKPDVFIAEFASLVLDSDAAHDSGVGLVTGDGALIKRGAGSLQSTDNNATPGSFTIEEGRLEISHVDGASILGNNATVAAGTQVAFLGINANDAVIGPAPVPIPSQNPTLLSITLAGDGLVDSRGAMRLRGTQIYSDLTLAVDATIQNAGGPQAEVYGEIDGPGGLTKIGNGGLYLHNDNTYAGPTIIENGNIRITHTNGFGNSPSLHIEAGSVAEIDASAMTEIANGGLTELHFSNLPAIISGSGSLQFTNIPAVDGGGTPIGGAFFDLTAAHTLAPGNSPGVITIENNVNFIGATYEWELADAGSAPGTGWDLVQVNANVDLAGGATLQIIDFNNALPTVNTAPGAITDFEIITANSISNFDPLNFVIGPGHFLEPFGTTNLFVNGFNNALILRFTSAGAPVPEPSTLIALAVLLSGIVVFRRRKPSHSSAASKAQLPDHRQGA